jgi:hypothetical protein
MLASNFLQLRATISASLGSQSIKLFIGFPLLNNLQPVLYSYVISTAFECIGFPGKIKFSNELLVAGFNAANWTISAPFPKKMIKVVYLSLSKYCKAV